MLTSFEYCQAIAEADLRLAKARSDMNAVERAIDVVNQVRRQLGQPRVPELPMHIPDPSLQDQLGSLPNGMPHYRRGFGFCVGQRVKWSPNPDRYGVVLRIFEYGRNRIIVFRADDYVPFWTSPSLLEATQEAPGHVGEACVARKSERLLLMPCSGMKLDFAAPASTLYTGVMWQSLRANWCGSTRLAILSAKHGIVLPHEVLAPYDQRLDQDRVDELLDELRPQTERVAAAIDGAHIDQVLVAGGHLYRQVLLAIVAQLKSNRAIGGDVPVNQTVGGIGEHRAQLGAFLRSG
ncbi:MAG: hypothetical protein E6Q67_03060 [Roseateles sp.]|nr:MAG: hypothetical protein E6Q67_03060 [Roseateles sp.]